MDLHSNGNKHRHSRQPRSGNDLQSGESRSSDTVFGVLSRAWAFKRDVHRTSNDRRHSHRLAKRVYAIVGLGILCLASPVKAEETPVTAIANPQATSTGSVTNQAVQVLQGPYATNNYGGGISCQGPTLNFTPFIATSFSGQSPYEPYADMDGDGIDDRTGQKDSWSFSPGASLTISIPLDSQLQDQCKRAATTWNARQQAELDKARLDFELVRLLRCGEAMRAGVTFHPDSPYATICSDVVVAAQGRR